MEAEERRTTRPRFLRQVAVTLAAAVGAGALASRAWATPGQCCFNQDCSHCGGTGTRWCYCDCTGISGSYCWTNGTNACLASTDSCVPCPC